MTVLVLGWDALDARLARGWPVDIQAIDTIDNPEIGYPHTAELWPSLITGVPPSVHGVHAVDEDGVEWANPLLNRASTAAQTAVPDRVRTWLGRRLAERGARPASHGVSEYDWTVFDDRHALPLSIPNAETDRDRRLGLTADRRVYDVINRPTDTMAWTADATETDLLAVLEADLGARVAVAERAMQAGYDLVWVWFGYLDSAGHLDPSVGMPLQERAYRRACQLTERFVRLASDDDAVVVVSDHGLREGHHTHRAAIGGTDPRVYDADSVLDVAGIVDGIAPARQADERAAGELDAESVEHMEQLGYL